MRRLGWRRTLVLVGLVAGLSGGMQAVAISPGYAAGLSLCFVFNGEESQGCRTDGAATSPASYEHLLRVKWKVRRGDVLRIRGFQDRPTERRLGKLGVLKTCLATPCNLTVKVPRRGGIVSANYWAELTRGGRTVKSNVVRFAWRTSYLVAGVWRGQDGSTYTLTQSGNVVKWDAHAANNADWCHVFSGRIDGAFIEGDFTDLTRCGIHQTGHIVVEVTDTDDTGHATLMRLKSSSVGFGTSSWRKVK